MTFAKSGFGFTLDGNLHGPWEGLRRASIVNGMIPISVV